MDGYVLIDKPAGWTSFDVVAKFRGLLKERTGKKVKVGHAGTLDPFATGLLIVLYGNYTKRQDEFMKLDKVYEATFTLGATSTTGDPEGIIELSAISHQPSAEEVQEVLKDFTGEIEQTPPAFSAIKVGGKKAYELARAGKSVPLKARKVRVYRLEVIDYVWPELQITAHVSSGTYIRSLAVDIGEALGTGAYCSQLRRSKIGNYSVENGSKIDKLNLSMLL